MAVPYHRTWDGLATMRSAYNISPHLSHSQMGYNGHGTYLTSRIRVVQLRRRGATPLGFSIRGGWEHGTGVFVSEVQLDSEAYMKGLRVGDQIIRINGFAIDHAIHEEVLSLLRAKPTIILKVKSVGMIPVKDKKRDPLTWKYVQPDPSPTGSILEGSNSFSSGSSLDDALEIKVYISTVGTTGLGCSIVKGPPDMPGIYVQSLKSGGLAEQAGLQVGDQVIDVNGHSFLDIPFADAVSTLKSCKEITLTVKKGAGLELFPEERTNRYGHIGTKTNHGDHRRSASDVRENSKDVRSHHFANGYYSPKVNSHSHSPKKLGSTLNGSLPELTVEMLDGDTRNHTRAISMDCVDRASAGESCPTRRDQSNHSPAILELENQVDETEDDARKQQDWLKEERRKLEEEQKRLQEEAEKLAEERRKLEEDRRKQDLNGLLPGFTQKRSMLEELQQKAERRSASTCSQDGTERSSISSGGSREKPWKTVPAQDKEKHDEAVMKRRQHEMLMEEFREAHKKMFGALGHDPGIEAVHNSTSDEPQKNEASDRRQQVTENPPMPTPPPVVSPSMPDASPQQETVKTQQEHGKLTVSNEDRPKGQGQLYRPVLLTSPPQIPTPDYENKPSPRTQSTPSKQVTFANSKGGSPKPPRMYFPKSSASKSSPLVTIGTYPSSNHNRFVSGNDQNSAVDVASRQNQCKPSQNGGSAGKVSSSQITVNVRAANGGSSMSSSSNVTEHCPPVTFKVTCSSMTAGSTSKKSSDSTPKVTININSRPLPSDSKSHSKGPAPKPPIPDNRNTSCSAQQTVNKEDIQESTGGRVQPEVKTFMFTKGENLNMKLGGGLNSEMGDKIVVADLWPGGLIPLDGNVRKGDQILTVDNTRVTNVSLSFANAVLTDAMSSSSKHLKLTVARDPKS